MFDCKNTAASAGTISCPNCRHEFKTCCQPFSPLCCPQRRASHALSGGIVTSLEPPPQVITTPCQSPNAPLTFVMPPSFPLFPIAAPQPDTRPEYELERLQDTVRALRISGWYYEGLTYVESQELLKGTKVGTFLVRDSSDPRFLYSLSVQTERGPTSIRLHYYQGYFRLDAQSHLQTAMPMFATVAQLVEHYVNQSKLCRNSTQVWVDPQGKWYSPIVLDQPLLKENRPRSLKHSARLAINRSLRAVPRGRLDLPKSLAQYLDEYPHCL